MRSIDMSDYNSRARAYWWITTLAGAGVCFSTTLAVLRLDASNQLELTALIGIVFLAGMHSIRIPGTQAVITPSDFVTFFAAILLGPAAATTVAVIDAFVVSYRNSRRWTSRLGGPALIALSIFVSANLFDWMLRWRRGLALFETEKFLIALLIFACVYFVLNSLLLTTFQAFKNDASFIPLWLTSYFWAGLTYMASASAAGLTYFAIKQYGLAALLAAGPIVAVIFSTSYFYFKQADERARADRQSIEAAETHARQVEGHVKQLEESEERFHTAFDHAAIGMALVASDGRWLQANRALSSIVGYSEEEMLQTNYQCLTQPEDVLMTTRHLMRLLADEGCLSPIEMRFVHKLGHSVWVLLSASIVCDSKNGSRCFIFQIQDIADKKSTEEKLAHALRDALTDLPNRALFMDHLKMAIARVTRHADQMFAVLFLDLDRFKVINDSLGHLAGDQLLVAIARRLEGCVRPTDTLARLGGDEFTILVEDLKSPNEAVELAERIQAALATPFRLGDLETFISSSIGIAPSNLSYQNAEEILRDADTAMYRAKTLGKARYALFDQDMHSRALKRLQLETDLRRAVEREEFSVVYQPIVSLATARLVGFEALVRWQNADGQFVNPEEFIPVAEEIGFIGSIGQWVLEHSCRQMRHWHQQSPGQLPLTVSVNVSGKQLTQDLLEQVRQTLKVSGMSPQHLKLEITESAVMEKIDVATGVLEQLRALGIQLSMDDFGTGYSSLSYLRRLPIDTLKIDRSFVTQMAEDGENAEIVHAVINLAKSLGMSVIAEGVETREQLKQLQGFGCDCAQGYLISTPLGAEEAGILVSRLDEWRAFDQSEGVAFAKDSLVMTSDYTM